MTLSNQNNKIAFNYKNGYYIYEPKQYPNF